MNGRSDTGNANQTPSSETLKHLARLKEKYYGPDALARFEVKEKASRDTLKDIYENPIWVNFEDAIDQICEKFVEDEKELKPIQIEASEAVEVKLDNRHYGKCPRCGNSFDYRESDFGRLLILPLLPHTDEAGEVQHWRPLTLIDFEKLSNENMLGFFRYELLQVSKGRRLNRGVTRVLLRLGFISFLHAGEKPRYLLTPKARELLEGSGP
jgi:hypothetical protein